jgi:hypothetical protein
MFVIIGKGEPFNNKYQEASYDSQSPEDKSNTVRYYWYPVLKHGDKVLVKGKVHVNKSNLSTQTTV